MERRLMRGTVVGAARPEVVPAAPSGGADQGRGGPEAGRPGGAPVDGRAHELLARADGELLAAQFSPEAWEQFSHAHLAALRAGAAVVAARGRPGGRRAPRTVWDMLTLVAPELAGWSEYFARSAALRSSVDAGRFELVSPERAEQAVCAAEDFVDAARALVEEATQAWVPRTGRAPRTLTVRAS